MLPGLLPSAPSLGRPSLLALRSSAPSLTPCPPRDPRGGRQVVPSMGRERAFTAGAPAGGLAGLQERAGLGSPGRQPLRGPGARGDTAPPGAPPRCAPAPSHASNTTWGTLSPRAASRCPHTGPSQNRGKSPHSMLHIAVPLGACAL